jgi:diguanylate cyclase
MLALIMLDIDHFKRVNDTYGHPLGDRVIAAVGQSIRECVGQAGVAARYGGEEFAVLLPSQQIEIAERLAQSIRKRVEQGTIRRRHGEEPIDGVTVSAGVAVWHQEDDTSSLIERADRALYASKRAGRNRVTVDWLQSGESHPAELVS